jgi:transcriptional regulator with GAF, ATPase, and Fis domain
MKWLTPGAGVNLLGGGITPTMRMTGRVPVRFCAPPRADDQMPDAASTTTSTSRVASLAETFVELADTVGDDFDPAVYLRSFTRHCVELLRVSAAAAIVFDEHGALHTAAGSCRAAHLLSLFAQQVEQGPGVDCARTGRAIAGPRLSLQQRQWPRFTAAASECGYQAAHTLPMRRSDQLIGVLTLFDAEPGPVADTDLQLAQSLADVTTVALLQRRAMERSGALARQLQAALNSRIVIEQAKGVLAAHTGLDVDAAFSVLRSHARLCCLIRLCGEGQVEPGEVGDVWSGRCCGGPPCI